MSLQESDVIKRVETSLPPCCLRIFQDKFILVGTYDLDKPTGFRTGSIVIYNKNLELLNTYSTYGAILDLKLSPFDNTLVITGHSTGNISIWKIENTDSDSINLSFITSIQVYDPEILITSLHFSPLYQNLVTVTATSGESAIIDLTNDSKTSLINSKSLYDHFCIDKIETPIQLDIQNISQSVIDYRNLRNDFTKIHDLECWTAEFGCLSPLQSVLFTAGDDSSLIAHDLRTLDSIWSNNRIHSAGVTSIKTSTNTFRTSKPTSIITGSYDDHIRCLDLKMLGDNLYPGSNIPVFKKRENNLNGGVWRLIENPNDPESLLVCCMYNGAKIVKFFEDEENDDDTFFQETNYLKTGHESMCYGGDWSSELIATCSFYDKSLQVWNP